MKKEAILFSTWDIQKFFDSESLVDVMSEPYKCQVKGKIYRLIFKMNENIRISVKTPVGETEFEDTNESVGQGTIDGAVISSVSIDQGVNEKFGDKCDKSGKEEENKKVETKIHYKELEHPVIFQDYIGKLSANREQAQIPKIKWKKEQNQSC